MITGHRKKLPRAVLVAILGGHVGLSRGDAGAGVGQQRLGFVEFIGLDQWVPQPTLAPVVKQWPKRDPREKKNMFPRWLHW